MENEWRAFAQVVAILIQDPRNIDRLKQGHRLPERYRRAMTQMVTVSVPAEDAEFFVDTVLADMASVLRGAVAVTTPSITLPESSESPGPIQQVLGASALLAVLRRAAKRAERDPRPQIAWSNGRIRALAALAMRLAEDGREDQGAATELRGKVGRHHADLTRAAALIRSRGSTKEDRIRNRANRLLLAAAANTTLQPEAPEEAAVLDRLGQLQALPLPDAYAQLSELVPALAGLKDRIAADATASASRNGSALGDDDEERIWDEILEGLQPLLGPEAETNDELLASPTAFWLAQADLANSAGLPSSH